MTKTNNQKVAPGVISTHRLDSRLIKFRAWDKERDEMLGPETIIHLEGETTKALNESAPFLILLQFTGLYDLNNREVYEGDIVEWLGFEVRSGKQIRPKRRKIILNFIQDTWELRNISQYNNIEVIGNIYENPELLTGI